MRTKVLVVDDSASDRLIIQRMLSDYSVLLACDGLEAMRQIEEHEDIGIIILDLKMPNMDGFAVLEALKSNPQYKGLRTIILTNYEELGNEIRGLRMGAVDYIRKPINMHSLRARIEVHNELLRAQRALEQKVIEQKRTFDTVFQQAAVGIAISFRCLSRLRGGRETNSSSSDGPASHIPTIGMKILRTTASSNQVRSAAIPLTRGC